MFEDYLNGVKERISATSWRLEATVLSITLVTVALYLGGQYLNKSKFQAWINSSAENLKDQFAQVGVTRSKLYIQDDDQHYTTYATGRINIAQFIMSITLQSRQNFTLWIMEHVFGFFFESLDVVNDEVDIVAVAHKDTKVDPFIWAIVNKENMNKSRIDNYYLSLTRTFDSDRLPTNFVFMTENAAFNDLLFDEEFGEVLSKASDVLQYIAFTDQQAIHPTSLAQTEPKFRAIIKFNLKTDSASLTAANEVVNKVLERVDYICSKGTKFRPEITKKILKTREAEVLKLQKLIDQDKKEQLEEKKLEELKKQREKLKSTNPKELERLEKKQKEKQQRKMMKKQRVRG